MWTGASPNVQAVCTATPSWSVSSAWVIASAAAFRGRSASQQLSRGRGAERGGERKHHAVGPQLLQQLRERGDRVGVRTGDRGRVEQQQAARARLPQRGLLGRGVVAES